MPSLKVGVEIDKSDIVNKIHIYIGFFKARWDEFCPLVEKCGGRLNYCQERYEAEMYPPAQKETELTEKYTAAIKPSNKEAVKRLLSYFSYKGLLINGREKLRDEMDRLNKKYIDKGWHKWDMFMAGQYLNLPGLWKGAFYAPLKVVNPLLWLLNKRNSRGPEDNEKLLCDCALLSIVYDDEMTTGEKRICCYEGTYFQCDNFCRKLLFEIHNQKGRIQRALYDVNGSTEFKEWCAAAGIPTLQVNNDDDINQKFEDIQTDLSRVENAVSKQVALGAGAPTDEKTTEKKEHHKLPAESKLLAVLVANQHKGWPKSRIAAEAGVSRPTMYKCLAFLSAYENAKQMWRDNKDKKV